MSRPEQRPKIHLNPHNHREDGSTFTTVPRWIRKLKRRRKNRSARAARKLER
jgi:hypothetical protein